MHSVVYRARPTRDEVFLNMAREVGRLTTCPRALRYGGIGAVLVEQATHRSLGFGYCGSLPGMPHCTDVGCEMVDSGCRRTQHAEANAIRYSRELAEPKTLYTTVSPCEACFLLASRVMVKRIVYATEYRIVEPIKALAIAHEIELVHLP